VTAVQYTFTHRQYTEQHNETEYTERNGTILYDIIYDMIYDMLWLIWYDIVWYNVIWYNIDMIRYGMFVNCSRVATQWQQYSTHLHKNSTQKNTINLGTVLAVTRLCGFYSGIWLTAEENAWKNLSQGSQRVPIGTMRAEMPVYLVQSCIPFTSIVVDLLRTSNLSPTLKCVIYSTYFCLILKKRGFFLTHCRRAGLLIKYPLVTGRFERFWCSFP